MITDWVICGRKMSSEADLGETSTDDKDFDGPLVTLTLGLDRLREHCPHFGEWITWLENL